MRNRKIKNIFSTLLPLIILCLIFGAGAAIAGGTKGTPRATSEEPLKYTPPIPANPRVIEQIFIPGGKVTLGSDSKEKAYAYTIGSEGAKKWRWFDGEKKREVFVADFYIDKYPVTQAQYFLFVRDTGHRAPFISATDYRVQGFLVHSYEEVRPYLWQMGNKDKKGSLGAAAHRWSRPPADKLEHPVVLVSAKDAKKYCQWRGSFYPKKNFALPSEDQWEKAARGTDGRYFPWGNVWDKTRANIGNTGPQGTSSVNRYEAGKSPYGVYEMAGNIFEWTDTPSENNLSRQILKSCSWDDQPGICRGAARHSRPAKSRHILIGFRCVSTVE